MAGCLSWRKAASHTHSALPLSPSSTWPGNLQALPTLFCPQPSQQGKGPLVGLAGGRGRGSIKKGHYFLTYPRPMRPSGRVTPSLLRRALFYTNIFPPRSQPHFPIAPTPWTDIPKEGRDAVGLGSRTSAGVNKMGSPWLETPGSVEKHTHTHRNTHMHRYTQHEHTCPNIK